MQESQVTALRQLAAARADRLRLVRRSRAARRARAPPRPPPARRRGPVSPSRTTSSGPPASVVVSTGLPERNASNGTIPKSSSTRRVVDAEAARVPVGELLVGDAADELGAAVEPALGREPLQPLPVGPVAGDHDAQRRLGGGRLEQQVDPLLGCEPVDREDEVARLLAAVGERRRRMRHHLRLEPGRLAQPPRDVARGREQLPRLAERRPLELEHAPPQRAVLAPTPRTGRTRCGRSPTPAGTGAGARRPCAGGGLRRTGTSSRSTASTGRPFASSRSSSRQRNACVSTRSPGYHLNGTVTSVGLVAAGAAAARRGRRRRSPPRRARTAPAGCRRRRASQPRRSSSSTRRARSSTSRSSASLTIRCSENAGSTYQRIVLRSTRLTWNASQPFGPGRRSSGVSALTAQKRSASPRVAARSREPRSTAARSRS